MVIVPLAPVPSQQLSIVLDNQNCLINVLTRGEKMYLDLACDGEAIQNGALIQDRVSIIQIPTRFFAGTLAMVDTLGTDAPYYDGLGDRWQLCYWSEGEEGAPRNKVPEFDGATE